jgi:hypothetical protein
VLLAPSISLALGELRSLHSQAGDAGRKEWSMAHHKRGRRKDDRSGCLWCKSHKATGNKGQSAHQTRQERRARLNEKEDRA